MLNLIPLEGIDLDWSDVLFFSQDHLVAVKGREIGQPPDICIEDRMRGGRAIFAPISPHQLFKKADSKSVSVWSGWATS